MKYVAGIINRHKGEFVKTRGLSVAWSSGNQHGTNSGRTVSLTGNRVGISGAFSRGSYTCHRGLRW